MKCVVFLPGIMGSELRNSVTEKRVWPPKILDIIRKTVDVEELLSPDLVATRPIQTVARFFPVYRSLIKDINNCGYTVDGTERRFIPFAYDWRVANEESARALSDYLNLQTDFDEIVLIGHSMGGLVLRYLLESGEFEQQTWFSKVTQLITLGTPHNGAADALKQIAGLAANIGLTKAKVKRLASDPRYPSGYQLVAPKGSAITLRGASQNDLPSVIDPFEDEIVRAYDLVTDNVAAARNFWAKLNLAKRPKAVKYLSFVGSAHNTLYRLDWNGVELTERRANDSGDGTVPIVSSINNSIPHAFSQKKHATIFADRNLRLDLFKILGAPAGVTPHSADSSVEFAAPMAMGISTDREDYVSGDSMEVVVSFTESQTNPTCRFQMLRLDEEADESVELEVIGEPMRINFEGVALSSFKFTTAIDLPLGVYELRAAGLVDDPEPTMFMVTE